MKQAVRNLCPTAEIRSSLYVLENGSGNLQDTIQAWLKQIFSEE